jgi:hypothetical protein
MSSALLAAARSNDLPTIENALVQWLISERGAWIIVDVSGYRALRFAGNAAGFYVANAPGAVDFCLPLLPEQGDEGLNRTCRVWHLLKLCVYHPPIDDETFNAVLRVLVVKNISRPAPTRESLQGMHAKVIQEWVRLQARLPAYLAQRRALLNEHCLLIAPLRVLIHGYNQL